ncbi:hypothetical protein BJX65DRAFT_71950 [Aspergillus insuetus]
MGQSESLVQPMQQATATPANPELLVATGLMMFRGSRLEDAINLALSTGLVDTHGIAIVLSGYTQCYLDHFPLLSWTDMDQAKAMGQAFLLCQRSLFQNVDRQQAWQIMASLQGGHPCLSEAVAAALTGSKFEFDLITEPLNSILMMSYLDMSISYNEFQEKYDCWRRQPIPSQPFPIDTSFLCRLYFGATKNIFARVEILFPCAPMDILVDRWQRLRNTCRHACYSGYTTVLQQIMVPGSSQILYPR